MVSMGLLAFLVFGILAYLGLTLNMMPEVEFGMVTVQTVYPGAGPKEIEMQISKKIEDAVATISKIDVLQSYSMESVSFVTVQFKIGKDVNIANQEVKDKVNAILNELPQDAELPVVQKFDIGAFPIIDLVLTGSLSMIELFEVADKTLKDRLSQIEGVAQVNITGGEEREIRVELDNRVVYQNSISLAQLSQILAVQNMDMPGGNFLQKDQEYSVRFKGEFDRVETINQLEIPTPYGVKRLGQLANVRDTGAEVRERTVYFNNIDKVREEKVILLSVIKSADGNTVEMAKSINKELPSIERDLPVGCQLSVVQDASLFIESSVNDTLSNIILGIILTGLVLLFFLHDVRSTIIVALAMPMSILSTFLLMQLSGFTLNIMTLMGLSTAVGILVANSVVVLENIFRYKEMGNDRKIAAEKGTAEIAVAVIASTMTNIVVFLPLATMSSMVGQFFREFALTVTYATIFSLLISFTLTPMLASLILADKKAKKNRIGDKLEGMFRAWERWYQKILKIVLAKKLGSFLTVLTSVVLFFLSFFVAANVGFEFFPQMDQGDIRIEVEMPQGYNINETATLMATIEDRIKDYEEVKHILTTIGSLGQLDIGTNMALIQIKLVDNDQRELTSFQVASNFIEKLSNIPNAKIRVSAISGVGGGEAPIQFYLLGQDDAQLEVYKEEIINQIKDIGGLVNLNTSSRSGKPEITLVPDRQKISSAGLTVFDLAMTLRGAVEGMIATQYREAGNEYDIRVAMTDESVDTPEKVGNITVISPTGKYRLSQFADIEFTEGYSKILHKDKYKAIQFTGYVGPGFNLGGVVGEITARTNEVELASGYKVDWGGDAEMMQETAVDMLRTFIIALLLTYMLLAAILESFTQPLMILGTVPLALIGVFVAMFITGKTMNTISMMAIVMLLGIVVNNAILLLDYTNILRKRGKSAHDALLEACPTRLKPIIMSTIAIMLGMMPLALGIGDAGAEIRQPMGIVSIGGLIVSAVFTLVVIPAIYNLTTKSKKVEA